MLMPAPREPGCDPRVAPGSALPAARPARSFATRIAALERLKGKVVRLSLALPQGEAFDYAPGQYLVISADDSKPRCFSMASPPHDEVIELHIQRRREGRFSQWLARDAKSGDPLQVVGPYGDFLWRSDKAAGVIMLATGTGIAPLLAMLTSCFRRDALSAPLSLYWAMHDHDQHYCANLLRGWEARDQLFRFVPVISSRAIAAPPYLAGHVQDIALREHRDLRGIDVYACGAPAMVDEARTKFLARSDMNADLFFSDAFVPGETPPPIPSAATIAVTATLAARRTRIEARIGETLMNALRRARTGVLAVCGGQASCGTCRVRVAPHCAERLPAPSAVERRLLACLPGCTPDDRLACQITLTAEHDGLEICPSG